MSNWCDNWDLPIQPFLFRCFTALWPPGRPGVFVVNLGHGHWMSLVEAARHSKSLTESLIKLLSWLRCFHDFSWSSLIISEAICVEFHDSDVFCQKQHRSCDPQSRTKVGRRSLHATGLIDSWGVLEKMDMAKALALLRSGFLDQDDILEATSSCQLVPAPFSDQRILVSVLSKRPLIYGTTLVDILWYINNKFSYTHIFQVNICVFFIWYSKYYR